MDDGPGIRTTVFFKGCNLCCAWCHNPETKSPIPQNRIIRGRDTVCGREITVAELAAILLRDAAYYRRSGGGITFSGGEPMLQHEFLAQCLQLCKDNSLHTVVDTAGCVPFDIFEAILPFTDLFLYDIKHIDDNIHIKYTGVSNRTIIENLRKLINRGAYVIVRTLLLPGINDTAAYFKHFAQFISNLGVREVEVLPYHGLGESKYTQIGEAYTFAGRAAPDEKLVAEFKETIKHYIGLQYNL